MAKFSHNTYWELNRLYHIATCISLIDSFPNLKKLFIFFKDENCSDTSYHIVYRKWSSSVYLKCGIIKNQGLTWKLNSFYKLI